MFRVDARTRKVDVAISDPGLGASENTLLPVGINSIKIFGSYVYFTNSGQGTFGGVKSTYLETRLAISKSLRNFRKMEVSWPLPKHGTILTSDNVVLFAVSVWG